VVSVVVTHCAVVTGIGTVSEHFPAMVFFGLKTNKVFLDRFSFACCFFIIIIFFMKIAGM